MLCRAAHPHNSASDIQLVYGIYNFSLQTTIYIYGFPVTHHQISKTTEPINLKYSTHEVCATNHTSNRFHDRAQFMESFFYFCDKKSFTDFLS